MQVNGISSPVSSNAVSTSTGRSQSRAASGQSEAHESPAVEAAESQATQVQEGEATQKPTTSRLDIYA